MSRRCNQTGMSSFNLSKKYGTSSILIELSPKSLILNPAFSKISLFSGKRNAGPKKCKKLLTFKKIAAGPKMP